MKIQILSDLHNEFLNNISRSRCENNNGFEKWTGKIPITDSDLIILGGDIDIGVKGIEWAIEQSTILNKPIIYVAGNHEYYNREYQSNLKQMIDISNGTNVQFLECDEIIIDDCRILGATLWTDYNCIEDISVETAMVECKFLLNDHRLIRYTSNDYFSPNHARKIHIDTITWLTEKLDDSTNTLKTIVVTHHGPSNKCQHPKYPFSSISTAFQSNLDHLLRKADLWIYGHTHSNIDITFNGCRLISNQAGYPNEGVSDFLSTKVIEI